MCESDYGSFDQQRLLAEPVSRERQPYAVRFLRQVEEIGSLGTSSDNLASERHSFLHQANVGIWQGDSVSNRIMLSESSCSWLGLTLRKIRNLWTNGRHASIPATTCETRRPLRGFLVRCRTFVRSSIACVMRTLG